MISAVSVAIQVLAVAAVIAQERPPAAGESADVDPRRTAILQIIRHESPLAGPDLATTIRAALLDPDPAYRQAALAAVISRAAGPRIAASDAVRQDWAKDHAHLQSLRADVVHTLTNDPEFRVRAQAVSALASLDYRVDAPSITIAPSTEQILLARFYADPEARVRVAIVRGFASDANANSAAVVRLIGDAFKDPSIHVRHAAAAGSGKLEPAAAMALLVAQLNDQDARIRMQAAIQLARFGPQAARYRIELENALARETDAQTRQFIERALRAIADPR